MYVDSSGLTFIPFGNPSGVPISHLIDNSGELSVGVKVRDSIIEIGSWMWEDIITSKMLFISSFKSASNFN